MKDGKKIHVMLRKELHEQTKALAEKEDRSITAIVNIALREYVKKKKGK